MTFSEVKLWNELKNDKMLDYDFDRQRMIGKYIVDFYCKDLNLVIEVDGITHEEEKVILKDAIRQRDLDAAGVKFLRFNALLVVNKVEAAVKDIAAWIIDYEDTNGILVRMKARRYKLQNPPRNS